MSILNIYGITLDPYSIPKPLRFINTVNYNHPERVWRGLSLFTVLFTVNVSGNFIYK